MMLVVVAHPDDEAFGAGGSIAQMVAGGDQVIVAALSNGTSSRGLSLVNADRRREHFTRACQTLGAQALPLVVFPDQQSDTVPQLEINRAVEALIQTHQPSTVYTHHVGDLNFDHRHVAEAVLVATRGVCPVFCMTPEWPRRCVGPAWEPDITLDILEVLEQKVVACLCYQDELREYPHPRSEWAIREQPYEQFMVIQ